MEYLNKSKKDKRDITVYTGHLASANNKKHIKEFFLMILAFLPIVAVIIFPYQVGYIIGYWASEFLNGFKSNF